MRTVRSICIGKVTQQNVDTSIFTNNIYKQIILSARIVSNKITYANAYIT